jgi:uncharacterized protein YjbI with pentapeptide repeats
MKTIACPFCGEELRVQPSKCPHCRESISPPGRHRVLADQQNDTAGTEDAHTDFYRAYLSGAELRGAVLSGVDLFGIDLSAADLRGAELSLVNLCGADLSGADLRRANLYGADLSDANLRGADLGEATLISANLEKAIFDGFTIWPDDFDPLESGAIQVIS